MDNYLKMVFYWEGSLEDMVEFLYQSDQKQIMIGFMANILTDRTKRRKAEIHIANSLLVFEQEAADPSLFLTDPLLIDRWIVLLNRMLHFVPRNGWVKCKIMLSQLRSIARRTHKMRIPIAMAHCVYPIKMSGRNVTTASSLSLPN